MNLKFDTSLIKEYHSNSQKARILTENWIKQNMYCPRCGNLRLEQFNNNRPVADFYCPNCGNEYELKSKNGSLSLKINDGAYKTMLERITGNQNPDFFFMGYSTSDYSVKNLILVPKYFFVPDIIEKRKPLAPTARRAGWVGCNIIIGKIPQQGRIPIISDGIADDIHTVIQKVNTSKTLETKDLNSRGWLMDILTCINNITTPVFSLEDVYSFEEELQSRHPNNHNIRPKIRQQLQFLRDKGVIEFLGAGHYQKM